MTLLRFVARASAQPRSLALALVLVAACSGSDATVETAPDAPDAAAPVDAATPPAATTTPAPVPTPPPTTKPPAPPPATFTNPVIPSDCPDPGVLRVDGAAGAAPAFYMTCTGGKLVVRRSADLVKWTSTSSSILPSGKPSWAADGNRNWAPEIHQLGPASFVAYYTASDGNHDLAIGAAHAADPLGPWIDRGTPLVQAAIGVIDATFFKDDDGKQFLYWKVDGNSQGQPTPIMVRELAADGMSFAPGSSAATVLVNDPATWEGGVVEAPWVIKHAGMYFMFYAGNVYDARYRTGVARSASPTAPFTKKGAPILVNNARWVGPGHGSVVHSGNADWFVHHAWNADSAGNADQSRGRNVLLDPIQWASGWPTFATGSSSIAKEPAPLLP